MNKNKQKRAEDWLAEDSYQQKIYANNSNREEKKEIQKAKKIICFLKSLKINSMLISEKKELRNRIENSLKAKSKYKLITKWVAAAAIIIGLLGTVFVYMEQTKLPGTYFTQNIINPRDIDSTLLIIGDEKRITIGDINSEINYQSGQNNIQIIKSDGTHAVTYTLQSTYHTIVVPYGKRSKLTLADGTKVWLNSGSQLIFPTTFDSNKSDIYLQGEAIFDVTKKEQRKFTVNTDNFTIKVLGTIFNVTAYSEDKHPSTVLERGKIELTSRKNFFTNNKLVICPGTLARYNPADKSFSTKDVNASDYLAWREGYLILKKEQLSNIIKRISRYYNIEIILKDAELGTQTFSGYLDLKNSPKQALTIISLMVPMNIQKKENKLIINKKI